MPVNHIRESDTNTTRASRALRTLQAQLSELCEGELASGNFECFEREVHALFTEAECEVLGGQLESLDVDLPYVIIDGHRHHRVVRSKQTYTSAAGPVAGGEPPRVFSDQLNLERVAPSANCMA